MCCQHRSTAILCEINRVFYKKIFIMWFFNIFMIAAFIMQGSADTEFVDYLLDIQLRAHNLHLRMENTFEDTRSAMSEASERLIGSVLDEILEASHSIDDMVQTVADAVVEANASGNSECVQGVTQNWNEDIATSGNNISICSNASDSSIAPITDNLLAILDEAKIQSITVQNIVVNGFIDWNPLDPVTDLSLIIDGRLNVIGADFDSTTAEDLRDGLARIASGRVEIEERVRECLQVVVDRIVNNGNEVLGNLQQCD